MTTFVGCRYDFLLGQRDEGKRDGIFVDCLVKDDTIHRPAEVNVDLFLEHLNEVVQPESTTVFTPNLQYGDT